jgi:hypothetical protein
MASENADDVNDLIVLPGWINRRLSDCSRLKRRKIIHEDDLEVVLRS